MKPTVLVALPATLLAGCSAAGSTPDPGPAAVPAGVAEQHAVLAEEVEERGGSTTAGEWTVSYIVEDAEPWFEQHAGHEPSFREVEPSETNHVEIIPVESATGRIVPDVPVTVEVVRADGEVVQRNELGFYYATFFHYADNVTVPEGVYTLRATLGAPGFNRHGDPDEGPALDEGVTVEFDGVALGAR